MELSTLSAYNYFGDAVVTQSATGELGGPALLTDAFHFAGGYNIATGNTSALAALNINQIIVSNLAAKYEPCVVATTANITLSGLQTIDGVSLVDSDRVLVKDQTTTTQNGIYYAKADAWYRSAYSYSGVPAENIVNGKYVKILTGDTYAGQWAVTKIETYYNIDTSALLFDIVSESYVELFKHTNYF